jgi:hypothetical protein
MYSNFFKAGYFDWLYLGSVLNSPTIYHKTISVFQNFALHSPLKCLVWIKKCHTWLDQNFDPSLLTNKLWLVFMGFFFLFFFWKKKNQNCWLKKTMLSKIPNSKYWICKIEWCKGHWCSSTYMAVWLSDNSSKMVKKTQKMHFLPVFELMSDSLTAI